MFNVRSSSTGLDSEELPTRRVKPMYFPSTTAGGGIMVDGIAPTLDWNSTKYLIAALVAIVGGMMLYESVMDIHQKDHDYPGIEYMKDPVFWTGLVLLCMGVGYLAYKAYASFSAENNPKTKVMQQKL